MIAEVRMWGSTIGAVSSVEGRDHVAFQYEPAFATSGIEVAPLMMPLGNAIFTFPALAGNTFHGLPGLLADSLPDKFGNALIDAWLATQGRTPDHFTPIERLCYVGTRGMGALEYKPVTGPVQKTSAPIEIEALVQLASDVLTHRATLKSNIDRMNRGAALKDILLIGSSAGGARAKAVIAWNRVTNEIRSGQIAAGTGFEYWLLKFDGVSGNKDKEIEDPQGYGAIEYAYYLMATAAGIAMTECRLLEEHGRRHFMTRRFDRLEGGEKLHMQSLCAMAHFDFNLAGAYSYEQALLVMRQLGLSPGAIEEQFRRMVFNIVVRNQDDHPKNIAFLMDRRGGWSLAPAFDMTYSYNPSGVWTATHQMSMNGKRDNFTRADFAACAKSAQLKRGRAKQILEEVITAVRRWPEFATTADLPMEWRMKIEKSHRLGFD